MTDITRWRFVRSDGGVAEFAEDYVGPWVSVIDHYRAMHALRTERDDLQARVDVVSKGLEEMSRRCRNLMRNAERRL